MTPVKEIAAWWKRYTPIERVMLAMFWGLIALLVIVAFWVFAVKRPSEHEYNQCVDDVWIQLVEEGYRTSEAYELASWRCE